MSLIVQSMKELYWFGGGGRQPGQFYAVHSIVTDSHGNIYTTETYRGQRVQKFVYKGLVPLDTLLKDKDGGKQRGCATVEGQPALFLVHSGCRTSTVLHPQFIVICRTAGASETKASLTLSQAPAAGLLEPTYPASPISVAALSNNSAGLYLSPWISACDSYFGHGTP